MNKKSTVTFILVAFLTICAAVSINAQSNFPGKYYYDKSIDEGRNTLRIFFEFKEKNAAVYSNKQGETETQRRFGTWTYNKRLNQITVLLPPVKKNPMMGQEVKLTFVFRIVGDNLKLIRDLPYKERTGEIYRRF